MGRRRSHTAIPLVTIGHDRRLSLPTPGWGAERIGSGNEDFHQAILVREAGRETRLLAAGAESMS